MQKKSLSTNSIREALGILPLSQEEKDKRGILCRLAGPCASFFDPTRNERFYDEDLWDNVFEKNEIVAEMFNCGGIPMELDHPEADRDETKSMNIAAILPEKPKKDENGHLIAYIDVLDTPAGKVAYNLARYGFKWGISSRGSGDLYTDDNGNEAVDPNTYDFQTFDLVLLPAVKDARLGLVESFDKKAKTNLNKLKKSLQEDYNSYSEEEKLIMKENLDKLGLDIKLTEDVTDTDMTNIDELPTEVDGEPVERLFIGSNGQIEDDQIVEESLTEAKDDDIEDADMTVADVIEDFKTLGEDKFIEFETVEIDGVEYEADVVISEETDDSVVLKTVLTPVMDEDIEDADDSDDEEVEEAETDEDAAEDNGADEVVESMKELVRQNKMLESKIKSLNNEKTVSDAKVKALTEELNKVKAGFARTSELAAKAKSAEKMNESLKAQLEKKEKEIISLKESLSSKTKITENINSNNEQIKTLKENLNSVHSELTESKKKFEAQVAQTNKKLNERTELARKYKAGYLSIMQKFVESKAKMLGVKPAEITSRLPESYTVEDVEKLCESILNGNVQNSTLSFGRQTKVRIKETVSNRQFNEKEESPFEIEDWLKDYM